MYSFNINYLCLITCEVIFLNRHARYPSIDAKYVLKQGCLL